MAKRWIIVETKKNSGDYFEDVLKAGTTESEAVAKAKDDWDRLADSDKSKTTIEVGLIEYDEINWVIVYEKGWTPVWSSAIEG